MNTPRNASHWAARYLLAGYRRGASGPDAYDCWGLVRAAVRERHGIELPAVHVQGDAGAAARAAQAAGWRPAAPPLRDADVLFMRTAQGQRHVGMLVQAQGLLRLLHCVEGGPVWQPLQELPPLGYRLLHPWRLQP